MPKNRAGTTEPQPQASARWPAGLCGACNAQRVRNEHLRAVRVPGSISIVGRRIAARSLAEETIGAQRFARADARADDAAADETIVAAAIHAFGGLG